MASATSSLSAILILLLACVVLPHASAVRVPEARLNEAEGETVNVVEAAKEAGKEAAKKATAEAVAAGKSPSEIAEAAQTAFTEAAKEALLENAQKKVDEKLACFPASATITLASGATKTMAELIVSDHVVVGRSISSRVFMFTHALPSTHHVFVRLVTAAGPRITLTRSHHLYVNGALVAAGSVIVGDTLELHDGSFSRVVRIDMVRSIGLYNPQTMHGDIAVDGVRASTYTDAVQPSLAHALLAPLRAAYAHAHMSSSAVADGAPKIARVLVGK